MMENGPLKFPQTDIFKLLILFEQIFKNTQKY